MTMTQAEAVRELMTDRWHPAVLSREQLNYVESTDRVNVVVAGRRSFKTEGAKRRVVLGALAHSLYHDARFFCCAPTQQQAKNIFWDDLKLLVPNWALQGHRREAISDGELKIKLVNGAQIWVAGLDKPQRIEGRDWDGGVITEFGNCKSNVLDEIIRPMMTRGGWIDIEGVPEGRNHYYSLACDVQDGKRNGAYHHWTTEEVLHLWLGEEAAAEELADAQSAMDKLIYQQEYLARFITLEGQAYYAFEPESNVTVATRYDPGLPIHLCFDFNRSPGIALVLQEHPVDWYPGVHANKLHDTLTCAIGEVWKPRNSNTRKICTRLLTDWGKHTQDVFIHGDATGGAKTTAAVEGSDWDIIETMLKPTFGHRYKDMVPRANPPVRVRVNSVNTRLVAASGEVGVLINPKRCPNLIRDLEGVEADSAGEVIKEKNGPLTHISDAFGYYLNEYFPLSGGPIADRTDV